jgi:hypothetical protein
VEVAEHGVALPAAEEANEVAVNARGDEGHGASGTEGLDGDIEWVVAQEGSGLPEQNVDGCGGDHELSSAILFIVTVDRGVRRGGVATEVDQAPGKGADGAKKGVAASSMSNFFTTVGVLLIGERQDAEGGGEQVVVTCRDKIELTGTAPKLDLVSVERVRGILRSRSTVLARAHEKIVSNYDKVGNGPAGGSSIGCSIGLLGQVTEDLDGNRLDAAGRRVHFGVVSELVPEPQVNRAMGV